MSYASTWKNLYPSLCRISVTTVLYISNLSPPIATIDHTVSLRLCLFIFILHIPLASTYPYFMYRYIVNRAVTLKLPSCLFSKNRLKYLKLSLVLKTTDR